MGTSSENLAAELEARGSALGLDLSPLKRLAERSQAPGEVWPAIVTVGRRALAIFAPASPLFTTWTTVLVSQFENPELEGLVGRWRGRKHPVVDQEVVAALLDSTGEGPAHRTADALLLLMVIGVTRGASPDAARTVADGARKGRSAYLWRAVLLALPAATGSIDSWLAALAAVDAAALARSHAGLPEQSVRKFAGAVATLARLAASLPQRRPLGSPRAATSTPGSDPAGRRPSVTPPQRTPAVRTRQDGEYKARRQPTEPAAARRQRDTEGDREAQQPPHLTLEFEPDPQTADEPPAPVQLLLDLRLDQSVGQPSLDTLLGQEASKTFRLLLLSARLPWDWDHLNPHDLDALRRGLWEEARASTPHPGSLVAAMMLCTGLPVLRVGSAPFPRSSHFNRIAQGPKRRWRGESEVHLLEPEVQELRIPWPPLVVALAGPLARNHPGATQVQQLLGRYSGPMDALLDWLGPQREHDAGLRLTHGRISKQLASTIRAISGAEWIVHAAAGTDDDIAPTAAYYSAAPANELAAVYVRALDSIFANPHAFSTAEHQLAGLVGARVVRPLEVSAWIQSLGTSVVHASDQRLSLVERHNAFANYVVWLLMAATAHRPVLDPFESITNFDLAHGFCLIADKAVRQVDQARVVPLGPLARRVVKAWIDHVQRLRSAPISSTLKASLGSICEPGFAQGMPLLFLLELRDGDVVASAIGETELEASLGLLAEVPANFLRRQLASHLMSCRVSDELIRSLMGHEETGVDPLGAYSPHCASVLTSLGSIIDDWLRQLGWQCLASPLTEYPPAAPRPIQPVRPGMLGSQLRQDARRALQRQALREARQNLARWLREARRINVTQDSLTRLFSTLQPVRQLVSRDVAAADLMSRAHEHCLRFIERAKLEHAKLPPRHKAVRLPKSPFCTGDLRREDVRRVASQAFRGALRDRIRHGVASQARRFAEFIVSLVLHSLVGDNELIAHLLNWPQISILHIDGLPTLLCVDHVDSGGAVLFTRRYSLHPATRRLLLGHRQLKDKSAIPALGREFESLVRGLWARADRGMTAEPQGRSACVRWLTGLARPLAHLRYPGFVAGLLDGEAPAVGLSTAWLMTVLGHVVVDPAEQVAPNAQDVKAVDPIEKSPSVETLRDEEQMRLRASRLHLAARAALSRTDDDEERDARKGVRQANRKRDAAAALRTVLDDHADGPELQRALVQWVIELLQSNLKLSTCSRYYFALGLLIRDLAFDLCLEDADDSVLSDTYEKMLSAVPERGVEMVLGRLREFHAFLQSRHGVAEVDWAEIVPENARANFSPDAGFVTEHQYERALGLLAADPTASMRDQVAQVVVLVLMYRFGLRIGEALALRRCDLIKINEMHQAFWIVLVRPNEHRLIKSPAGVRQVPLLEPLSEFEADCLERWRLHADEQAGEDRISVLFNADGRSRMLLDRTRVTTRLTQALCCVTGRASVRLHHLRHSYATRMSLLVSIDETQSLSKRPLISRLSGGASPGDVRRRLLGRDTVDGRGLWAVAGILGHAAPRTTVRWYAHAVELLAAALATQVHQDMEVRLSEDECRYWEAVQDPAPTDGSVKTYSPIRLRSPNLSMVELPPSRRLEPVPLTLGLVDRIVDAAYRTGSVSRVSQMVMQPADEVERVLAFDLRIRRATGYDLPGGRWAAASEVQVGLRRLGSRRAQESERLLDWWPAAQQVLDGPAGRELARTACGIWQSRFRASSTPLVLKSPEEVGAMCKWLEATGVDMAHLAMTFDAQGAGIESALADSSVSRRDVQWLANARVSHRKAVPTRLGLQVMRNRDGAIPSTAAMHRAMHVSSVWLACNEDKPG